MIPIDCEQLAYITGGTLISSGSQRTITNVCIDSRTVVEGALFVPIPGEHFDGHDFISIAFDKGAAAVLVEKTINSCENKWIIHVDNTVVALQKLAKYYKNKFDIPFIAVTGSSGKTTTKDLIYSVLSKKYNVLRTKGNQNNDLGVPLTIFQLEKSHEMAIIEMGMDHLGEISRLADIVKPNISIITNIGVTHIENLKTQENIFKAKCEILQTLDVNDIALINGDDNFLRKVESDIFSIIRYGINEKDLDITAFNIISNNNGVNFDVKYNNSLSHFHLRFPGNHNVYNSMAAIFLGFYFKMTSNDIQLGLDEFKPSNNRMDIKNIKDTLLINDCYNANPDSMKSALNVLSQFKNEENRTIAVLGDMFDLGSDSHTFHYNVGEYLANLGNIDYLVAIGNDSKYYIQGACDKGFSKNNCCYFLDNNSAANYLLSRKKRNDCLLIKGSRGMKMEEIVIILERS